MRGRGVGGRGVGGQSGPTAPTRSERGGAFALNAALIATLVIACGVCWWFASWIGCVRHAGSAASLAALAGAQARSVGDDACPRARRIAEANQAKLAECEVAGGLSSFTVLVKVEVELRPEVPGGPRTVAASAKAGAL